MIINLINTSVYILIKILNLSLPSNFLLIIRICFSQSVSLFLFCTLVHWYEFIDLTCVWYLRMFVCFSLTFLTWFENLSVHPCCCQYLCFILFDGWVVVWCIDIPCSLHFSVSGHFGGFYVLAVVSSAGLKIGVQVSFWMMNFSRSKPGSGVSGSCATCMFSVQGNSRCFPQWFHQLHSHQGCTIPSPGPLSVRPLQRSLFIDLLYDGSCDPCEEMLHCSCDWHRLNNYWCGVCFHVFLLFFCYVLLLFVIVHLVSTIYFLNLLSWKLALYGILFRQFTPGHFLRAGVIYSPVRLVTIKIPSACFLWYIY